MFITPQQLIGLFLIWLVLTTIVVWAWHKFAWHDPDDWD